MSDIRGCFPLIEACGGSVQLWWLGSNTPSNGVWSRPRPKLHANVLIALPDVEPECKAQQQIRVKEGRRRWRWWWWRSHRSISDWKRLLGSGEHLIICDANQLKTLHLLTCTFCAEEELIKFLRGAGDDSNSVTCHSCVASLCI